MHLADSREAHALAQYAQTVGMTDDDMNTSAMPGETMVDCKYTDSVPLFYQCCVQRRISKAVFLCCHPDCLSCWAHLNSIGWATWTVWAATKGWVGFVLFLDTWS